MAGLKVLLSFNRAPDMKLVEFGTSVSQAMTGNSLFTKPPVTIEQLNTAIKEFADAIAAMSMGGVLASNQRNVKRSALLGLLGNLANYVQATCKNDLGTLLASGFEAVVLNRTRSPLEQPLIISIAPAMSTQLKVRVKPVNNARSYEARVSSVPNQWQSGGVFTNSRQILIADLTPGTFYTVQVRAVGGSTGHSDWSDPTSHMAL